MTLSVKRGDLFANVKPFSTIVHGVNAQGKMASGFAKTLRDRFPEAYRVYKQAHAEGHLKLGEISGFLNHQQITVVNAVTQQYYGRDPCVVYVDYDAVRAALTKVVELAKKRKRPNIHLPFIGGGLANGDREVLMGIFNEVFADEEVNATLWIN